MTQQEKELLLKDLSARLPYGVVYHRNDGANIKLNAIDVERGLLNYTDDIEERECKPYLRPMSSMTEDERKQLSEYIFSEKGRRYFTIQSNGILYSGIDNLCFIGLGDDTIDRLIDWLNEHHFDVRNLIEKNLALEAPSGMYKK